MTESIVPDSEKPRVGVEASFVEDVKSIIEDGVVEACASVQRAALLTYWRVGRRIVEEEQGGSARAEYGAHLIEGLAKELFPVYGTRYSERRLREFRRFYLQLPDFGIWHSRVPNLTWTHVRQVLPEENADARRQSDHRTGPLHRNGQGHRALLRPAWQQAPLRGQIPDVPSDGGGIACRNRAPERDFRRPTGGRMRMPLPMSGACQTLRRRGNLNAAGNGTGNTLSKDSP